MAVRFLAAVPVLALTGALTANTIDSTRPPAAAPAPAPAQDASTLEDQTELSLTVYNSDLALVRDVRTLQLSRGVSDLRFMDVAATVNPATVHFRSLTEPSRLGVLEQNYEYDLLEPEKLLRKYVGRDVTLVRTRQEAGTVREEAVTARLLSYNNAPVWQIGGEIVTGYPSSHIRFPELPGNLFARPTLIWSLNNEGGTRHRVEASYLATKLSWNADYVLTVARDDKSADLDGWVTITNGSGTGFRNASLQLVAGELNRVRQAFGRMEADLMTARAASVAEQKMTQEAFSDYHLYTLERKTTVNNNQTKQVSMLGASAFPVAKQYVVNGQSFYYRNVQNPGAPIKDVVQVFYQFKNETKSGLGLPMPSGTVRVYQRDARGNPQFVGEHRIGHTPMGSDISLATGQAFDVKVRPVVEERTRLSGDRWRTRMRYTLTNAGPKPVTVDLVQAGLWGDTRITDQSMKSDRTSADETRWRVPCSSTAWANSATGRMRTSAIAPAG